MKASEHILKYHREATSFNEALPLGNGRIGAMVYGGIVEEKISLNEDTLWSGYPKDKNIEDYPSVYRNAIERFDEGEIAEAQKLLENHFGDYLVQMYQPLADLKIRMQHGESDATEHEGTKHIDRVSQYSRTLKLNTAIHAVSYVSGNRKYIRECFVSEPYQVMAVRLYCDKEGSINFETTLEDKHACEYSWAEATARHDNWNTGKILCMHGTTPNFEAEYGTSKRSMDTRNQDRKGISYICAVSVNIEGGSVSCHGNAIKVENADEAVLYFAARTNFIHYDTFPSGDEYKKNCLLDIETAINADYEVLKKKSIRAHRKFYNRCSISLADNHLKNGNMTTNERLLRLQNGEKDNALYALLFNFGKYLTITGSREGTQPLNLQGIWNDKVIPPWSSNYTLNINMEMNYWPTLTMGLWECYEPFVRFVEELAQAGSKTAESYYGVEKGWVCHHSSDIWRLTHPGTNRIAGNAPWGFWNMASGWLSVMLWNYYRYTLDTGYLERVFPVIEGAARFYRELLVECEGELILPLSTSPENNYIEIASIVKDNDADGSQSTEVLAVDKSTAMTQEILYDLFSAVSKAASVLDVTDEYGTLAARLRRPLIQTNGELCEWHEEHDVWDVHHRHVSHLYGLFPSCQFMGDAKMKEACKKVLLSRGDGGTGWSLAWKINLWARLGDSEHALKLLNNQLRLVPTDENAHDTGGGSYPNLFCAHPPFQIDGNFGATNGIMEMLVQCDENGEPVLLPACPKEWDKGSVKNLRLPGNRKISFSWENGKVTKVICK